MEILKPMKAIRAKCLDCTCGSSVEVKLCEIKDCALYPYRFGKNPNRKGIGNSNPFNKRNSVLSSDFEK